LWEEVRTAMNGTDQQVYATTDLPKPHGIGSRGNVWVTGESRI
jgi:hypothetical protein